MKTSVYIEDDSTSPNVIFLNWELIISNNAGPPYFVTPLVDQTLVINSE